MKDLSLRERTTGKEVGMWNSEVTIHEVASRTESVVTEEVEERKMD